MIFEKFNPEVRDTTAERALFEMMKSAPDRSYADMIRLRISGGAAAECDDTYFVALEGERCVSRLWHGWGRHENAIGNFGNFLTLEEARGTGVGRKLLGMWIEDLEGRAEQPLGLFCSAYENIAPIYFPYGFRVAVSKGTVRYLYKPLGDSPESFQEFCRMYYTPSPVLLRRPASIGWRHEIDCLLKFALADRGLPFGFGEINLEAALLYHPGKAELLFTPSGRCVGWIFEGERQVFPAYSDTTIRWE